MSSEKFCFHYFDREIAHVLIECSYINLPFELENVFPEINFLLTKCGRLFFSSGTDLDILSHIDECCDNAKVVLDIAWEKINTGHWKDVDKNWRYVYTLASLFTVLALLVQKDTSKEEIVKKCDMALLMGAPLMKNIMSRLASKISSMISIGDDENHKEYLTMPMHKRIKIESITSYSTPYENKILEVKNVTLEDFMQNYEEKSKPVILLDAIKDWPAFTTHRWSIDYILEKSRFRTVPIEIGSKYTDDNWTQKLMTVQEFVAEHIFKTENDSLVGYLAQHNLFDQIPELFDDIKIPSYILNRHERENPDVDINVYFGPGGTTSPLHFDPKHNLLAQVFGEKYIRLYSKEYTDHVYPRENTWLSNTSQVDVENPDFEQFPLFKEAPYMECILRPGHLLYIPPGCWHYVRSISTSFSVSFWW